MAVLRNGGGDDDDDNTQHTPNTTTTSARASNHKPPRSPPLKQKMALGFRSLVDGAKRALIPLNGGDSPAAPPGTPAPASALFPVTDPAVDGDACTHDCDSCHVTYPRGFRIDEADLLYGHIKGWSTHVLVATSKADWVRDVADEPGSVMQALAAAGTPATGRLMLSASNMPTPAGSCDYTRPTTVLLLPAFRLVENVTPAAVPALVEHFLNRAPTNTSPLGPVGLPASVPLSLPDPAIEATSPEAAALVARPSPHAALVLLCSQKTRDARCGQSAPILRRELERHLRPLGLFRDLDDDRPGGVGVYFISHVGGHKYSANMLVYRRPDAFGLDAVARASLPDGAEELKPVGTTTAFPNKKQQQEKASEGQKTTTDVGEDDETEHNGDVGAAQCIWLARVKPEDCENIVHYTVLQGKVVKPDTQLRGGFDRTKGLMSW